MELAAGLQRPPHPAHAPREGARDLQRPGARATSTGDCPDAQTGAASLTRSTARVGPVVGGRQNNFLVKRMDDDWASYQRQDGKWHLHHRDPQPGGADADPDDERVCSMCNVGGYDEKNQIVFCDGRVGSTDARPCNLAVHQSTLAERATIVGARSHTRARAPACSGRPSRARSESGFPECYKVPQRYVDDADLPWHCEVHKVADDVAGTATSTVKLSDIVRALARGPSPQRWTHAPTSPAALTAVGVTGVWSRVWMRGR